MGVYFANQMDLNIFKKLISKKKNVRVKSIFPLQITTKLIMIPKTFNCDNVPPKLPKHC
jgi:hypothetical protein